MDIVNVNRVYLDKSTFSGNGDIESVDLNNTPFVNNDGSSSFSNCSYLTSVSNISNTTTEMRGAFFNCSRMTVPPSIPNSLTQTAHIKTHNSYYGFIPDENTTIFVPWTESPALEWWFDGPITPGAHVNAWYNYYDEELEIYDKGEIEDVDIVSVDGQNITVDCWGEPESATRNAAGDFDDEPFPFPNITGMFESCSNLTTAPTIPNGVTNIQGLCSYCSKITEVPDIPDSVTNMCEAFSFCNSINTIKFGNNVTDISGAYAGCSKVSSIPTIPNSVTKIGSAFLGLIKLTNMPHIPNTVTSAVHKGVSTTGAYVMYYGYPLNTPFKDKYNRVYNVGYLTTRDLANATGTPTVYGRYDGSTVFSSIGKISSHTATTFTFTNNTTHTGTRNEEYDALKIGGFEEEPAAYTLEYDTERTFGGAFEYCVKLTDGTNIDDGGLVNMDLMFSGCFSLENAFVPSTVQTMAYTFQSCNLAHNTPSIPNAVINMRGTFYGSDITTAPAIPNSVIDMYRTFMCCYDLTNSPVTVSNSAVNMCSTFQQCYNMTTAPSVIPNSVTDLVLCFQHCNHLQTIPADISSSVLDMYMCFNGCANMSGRTNIYSTGVINAMDCFGNCSSSKQKNVYIPFTYQNGEHTQTYNSFTDAGYSSSSRVNGVLLFDLGVQG